MLADVGNHQPPILDSLPATCRVRAPAGCPTSARFWQMWETANPPFDSLPPRYRVRARVHSLRKKKHLAGPDLLRPMLADVGNHQPPILDSLPATCRVRAPAGCPTSARFWQMWETANPPFDSLPPRYRVRARVHSLRKKKHLAGPDLDSETGIRVQRAAFSKPAKYRVRARVHSCRKAP
jgi:hypothetical protein